VSRAFPSSCVRIILTEIYLCHACSCRAIEGGHALVGRQVARTPRGLSRTVRELNKYLLVVAVLTALGNRLISDH
jgi:hypothetical protein